jgi:hypothetical protein
MKLLAKYLFFILLFSSTTCQAYHSDINKTFIALKDQHNRAIQMSSLTDLSGIQKNNLLGATSMITPFYQHTRKNNDLGGALLYNAKNYLQIINDPTRDEQDAATYINNTGDPTASGTLSIAPQEIYAGILCIYHHQLETIYPGLWMSIATSLISASANLNSSFSEVSTEEAGLTLPQYFAGKEGTNQVGLSRGKIDGNAHTTTALGDIECKLGLNVIDTSKYQIGGSIGIVMPTGTKPNAEFLFEPLVGTVHWALGCGLNINATLWEDYNASIHFISTIDYRYLLQGVQTRILELAQKGKIEFGRYALVTEFGAAEDTLLTPAANYLTRDFTIYPGSQLDATFAYNYKSETTNIFFGYNFFVKAQEEGILRQPWIDNIIGITQNYFDTTSASDGFGDTITDQSLAGIANQEQEAVTGTYLQGYSINLQAALTPPVATHKLFGSICYTTPEWQHPILLGLGCSYEFAPNPRVAFDGFTIFGKLGINF